MLFFCGGDVLAGFLDDQVRILFGQLPVLGIACERAFHCGQLVRRDMPGVIPARLPALEFLMPARGMKREFAPLHGGDGGNLFQQLSFLGRIHVCLES